MIRSRIGVRDSFGDRVRSSRLRLRPGGRKLTQGDLAKAVGVERNTVSRWENGGMLPKDPGVIGALAGALQVTADWLIGGDRVAAFTGEGKLKEGAVAGKYADPATGKLPARAMAVVVAYLDRMRERECTQDQIDNAESILLAGARNRVSSVALADRTDDQISSDIDAAWDLVVHILRRDGVRL
jgi:transcriptional regulator with XRE-family HTH domain